MSHLWPMGQELRIALRGPGRTDCEPHHLHEYHRGQRPDQGDMARCRRWFRSWPRWTTPAAVASQHGAGTGHDGSSPSDTMSLPGSNQSNPASTLTYVQPCGPTRPTPPAASPPGTILNPFTIHYGDRSQARRPRRCGPVQVAPVVGRVAVAMYYW